MTTGYHYSRALSRLSCLAAVALLTLGPSFGTRAESVTNFQGVLLNPDTDPPSPREGSHVVAFRVWADPFSSANDRLLWAESYELALDQDGYFSVLLGQPGAGGVDETLTNGGDHTPLFTDIGKAFEQGSCYIGVAVLREGTGPFLDDPVEVYPRRQILSAPYALYTDAAEFIGVPDPEAPVYRPGRHKYTRGRWGSTRETTIANPKVTIAEIRDFPVRPGASLYASFSTRLLFDLYWAAGCRPPRGRVTMDIRVGGTSVKKIRCDQIAERPAIDTPDSMRPLPVFLDWLEPINLPPDLANPETFMNADGDTLVDVIVTLSSEDAMTELAELDDPGLIVSTDGFSDSYTERVTGELLEFPRPLLVWPGSRLVFERPEADITPHELVLTLSELGPSFDFEYAETDREHEVLIDESVFKPGATYEFFCVQHQGGAGEVTDAGIQHPRIASQLLNFWPWWATFPTEPFEDDNSEHVSRLHSSDARTIVTIMGSNSLSNVIYARGFDFGIPSGSTILSVEVEFWAHGFSILNVNIGSDPDDFTSGMQWDLVTSSVLEPYTFLFAPSDYGLTSDIVNDITSFGVFFGGQIVGELAEGWVGNLRIDQLNVQIFYISPPGEPKKSAFKVVNQVDSVEVHDAQTQLLYVEEVPPERQYIMLDVARVVSGELVTFMDNTQYDGAWVWSSVAESNRGIQREWKLDDGLSTVTGPGSYPGTEVMEFTDVGVGSHEVQVTATVGALSVDGTAFEGPTQTYTEMIEFEIPQP